MYIIGSCGSVVSTAESKPKGTGLNSYARTEAFGQYFLSPDDSVHITVNRYCTLELATVISCILWKVSSWLKAHKLPLPNYGKPLHIFFVLPNGRTTLPGIVSKHRWVLARYKVQSIISIGLHHMLLNRQSNFYYFQIFISKWLNF